MNALRSSRRLTLAALAALAFVLAACGEKPKPKPAAGWRVEPTPKTAARFFTELAS